MLAVLGYSSLEDLVDAAVPSSVHSDTPLALDAGRSEHEVLDELRELAGRNTVLTSMIGLGYHGTVTPPVILRNVLENPAWYTAYTPYQPEISQGRLEALLNFQTVVTDLTGLPVAGASLLDEATAAAEAMTLARRTSKAPADAVFVVDTDVLPQTLAVMQTRAEPLGLEVVVADVHADGLPDRDIFGVLLQYPGTSGVVRDLGDVIAGREGQGRRRRGRRRPARPDTAALAGRDRRRHRGRHHAAVRRADGVRRPARRLHVGAHGPRAVDARPAGRRLEGRRRRPGLPARAADAGAAHPPREGDVEHLHRTGAARGRRRHVRRLPRAGRPADDRAAHPRVRLGAGLGSRGRSTTRRSCTTRSSTPSWCASLAGPPPSWPPRPGAASTCATSTTTTSPSRPTRRPSATTWQRCCAAFGTDSQVDTLDTTDRLPDGLLRQDDAEVLSHPVFHEHRSETAMLRYLRRLSDKDLALDRSMIPLGSCTMKLNATAEMEPITWPGFAAVHPFAPADQTEGYAELVRQLESWLRRGHRLRRRVAAAQRRLAGRARRAARHPGVPPRQRPG